MHPATKTVHSQPSWVLGNEQVELAVTHTGAHMAPVTFYRGTRKPVEPYYISPWQDEKLAIDVPVLTPLRGDFFCAPFGANAQPYRGERHACHGESATAPWTLCGAGRDKGLTSMELLQVNQVRRGAIRRRFTLADGHNAVYLTTRLEGFRGAMPLGHHATLAMPPQDESVQVGTSPIRLGMTNPTLFSNPRNREYQSLAIGKTFRSLAKTPLIWANPRTGQAQDFPTRAGFTDLLAVVNRPARTPAWTTATFTTEGFLWFAFKDAAVLPTTVFWISNRGRHGSPWNGRNCCLGLEDVCAYFAEGLAPSLKDNELTRRGVPTAVRLSPSKPTEIRYIQGVVATPRRFGRVAKVIFTPGQATFLDATGLHVTAPVSHEFLRTGIVRSAADR